MKSKLTKLKPNDIIVLIVLYKMYAHKFQHSCWPKATESRAIIYRLELLKKMPCTQIALTHSLRRLHYLGYITNWRYHWVTLRAEGKALVDAIKEQTTEWTT